LIFFASNTPPPLTRPLPLLPNRFVFLPFLPPALSLPLCRSLLCHIPSAPRIFFPLFPPFSPPLPCPPRQLRGIQMKGLTFWPQVFFPSLFPFEFTKEPPPFPLPNQQATLFKTPKKIFPGFPLFPQHLHRSGRSCTHPIGKTQCWFPFSSALPINLQRFVTDGPLPRKDPFL